jgi:hypothetical protein
MTHQQPKQSQTTTSNKPDNKQQTSQQRQQAPPTQHQMVLYYTPDEMLRMGLEVVGFNDLRRQKVNRATSVTRFKSYYGSTPPVCAVIWEDLVTAEIPEARIEPGTAPSKFFLGMYFLKDYRTEEKLAGGFKTCEKTARKWAWYFAHKIQALKAKKVSILLSLCLEVPATVF